MKRLAFLSVLLILVALSAAASMPSDRFSLNDFKQALKEDSSAARNSELAKEVLKRGVTFEYTRKRENQIRKWGANDELINAIYQSIADEIDHDRLYREFMDKHDSDDRDTRRTALEKGRLYLKRFESNERFPNNVAKVKEEIGFLECEFDPSLGC